MLSGKGRPPRFLTPTTCMWNCSDGGPSLGGFQSTTVLVVESFCHVEMEPLLVQLVPISHCPPHGLLLQRDPPSSAGLPCMSWGALMGSPESLQDKGLNFFSLSSQGRFSSSWATSFGSSPAASFVFGLWGQSCARAARLGSGSGSAAQPGAHSGSHRAARTVIPSAPDVTSSEHRLSCWLWPAPALVAHLPLSVPPTVCLCKHCFCVAIIILSVSLFMLSLTSHLEFACFHQLLQRRKVGRQFSAT